MEKPIKAKHIGCLHCGGNDELAPMDMLIAVGFGSAYRTKDGVEVYSEPNDPESEDECKTVADMESLAVLAPEADWRIAKIGPLKEGYWQRQGEGRWVLIKEGPGFA